ncbi:MULTISPECIES: nucleotidyltransferase family protein [unclassified Halorhodospira]|uniref:nucleotidyltransferase family protein n=1 Tax=unclassified Halorhodospira TaxID=2626748 RepID=UPI001EE88405|nr:MULTISPECIES: nucleotidyltransferase family protein [unclassified Halorhodospira]MCG5540853.1 nucleotidyltransferase family protein [Halorhodospira sp. M39old]MCG5546093.1 nucleotidyltransferase family protein [Halorhodospira sp. M38]
MKLESFKAIAEALERAEVRYLVAGGLAVNAHGYLRYTKDVDLVIELVTDNVLRAMDVLEGLGYRPAVPVDSREFADPDQRRRWIEEKHMQVFQLWSDSYPDTPIDIFVEEPFPFAEEYAAALRKPLYGTIDVRFVRLESLIRMKEAAGRDQDRIDVEHLRMRLDDDE